MECSSLFLPLGWFPGVCQADYSRGERGSSPCCFRHCGTPAVGFYLFCFLPIGSLSCLWSLFPLFPTLSRLLVRKQGVGTVVSVERTRACFLFRLSYSRSGSMPVGVGTCTRRGEPLFCLPLCSSVVSACRPFYRACCSRRRKQSYREKRFVKSGFYDLSRALW